MLERSDIEAKFQHGFALHQRGQLEEAARIYDEILAADRTHSDTLHWFGVLLYQNGDPARAIDLISLSIAIAPRVAIAHFSCGGILKDLGRFDEAIASYDKAIALRSDYVDAYIKRGGVLDELGRFNESIASYDKAIALKPDCIEAYYDRGTILIGLGHFGEAIASYDKAIALRPDHTRAYSNRGTALIALGRFEEAIVSYERTIVLKPDHARAYNNRGNALTNLRRFDDAIASYDKAIELQRDYAESYNNRATVLVDQKRFYEAIASYDKAIALRPGYAEAYYNRGIALTDLRRFDEAIAYYDRAIALRPEYADAYYNRGNALSDLRCFDEAVASYDKAIELRPDHARAHNNRGNALSDLRRFNGAIADLRRLDEAIGSYDKAIALRPDRAETYYNRGNALAELQLFDEALASYDNAIALSENYADAYFNRSLLELIRGNFISGWRDYEWRKKKNEPSGNMKFRQPFLASLGDIPGKTVLVHWEQGLGDTIQFCRYAERLQNAGAKVLFAPQASLRALMESLKGAIELADRDDQSLSFDYHVPLMSLPAVFGTTVETVPSKTPYLFARQERIEKWRDRIGGHGFKIGICWQGANTYYKDRVRSFPLSYFQALARTPGIRLINLHKGDGEGQLRVLTGEPVIEILEDFDAGSDAFIDTAAAMMCLDLVITSDTSIAHLGGALGVPTWVALQYVPDWRWMLVRSDSPWYPTMRLFRQAAPGDWNNVFAQISAALKSI